MSSMINGVSIYYIGEPETIKLAFKSKTGVRQVYSEIIKEHDASNPWEDEEFPRADESVGKLEFDSAQGKSVDFPEWDGSFQWKRIKDLVEEDCEASFFGGTEEEKISRFDLSQGSVGDCWMLAAVAELTLHPRIINFVIPADNAENNGSGAYHFRIRLYGCCIDVVVDDWLPCAELQGPGTGYNPVGVKPVSKDGLTRFWAPLIEKAYAKLNGTYAMLEGNYPRYAFEDFTGGLGLYRQVSSPEYSEKENVDILWKGLNTFFSAGNTFFSWCSSPDRIPEDGYQGLVGSHAYTMTGLTSLEVGGKTVRLVRLRNPWGTGEWEGDWSDESELWNDVDEAKKAELKLVENDDGEFWIEYQVLVDKFEQVDFCITIPEGSIAKVGEHNRAFAKSEYHGSWSVKGGTAGGSENPAQNPQYLINVGNPDDPECKDCLLAVSLDIKETLKAEDGKLYGYRIYKVSDPTFTKWKLVENSGDEGGYHMEQDFFDAPENEIVAKSGSKQSTSADEFDQYGREVADYHTVPPGTYLFLPIMWDEGAEANFFFRVWYDDYTYGGTVVESFTVSNEV